MLGAVVLVISERLMVLCFPSLSGSLTPPNRAGIYIYLLPCSFVFLSPHRPPKLFFESPIRDLFCNIYRLSVRRFTSYTRSKMPLFNVRLYTPYHTTIGCPVLMAVVHLGYFEEGCPGRGA